jgi:two-component sensor histidine kinase
VVGVLIDITAQKLAERRTETIAAEMQHRVKNTLAVVQTLAEQSLRNKSDIAAASVALSGRLRALAAANGPITAEGWAGSELRALVEQVLGPYRDEAVDPISIDGAAVQLPAKLATALGLALHELATNAVKYGALSVDTGRVSIMWSIDGGKLKLRWQESGGPMVPPNPTSGFGTRLLRRGLLDQGEVVIDFAPRGVVWTLTTSIGK